MTPIFRGGISLSRFWRALRRYFLAGVIVLAPLAITAYVLWLVFNFLDGLLGRLFQQLWGVDVPGVGAVALLACVLLVGLIATNVVGRQLISLGEHIVARIPVVRTVYGSVKQVIESFAGPNRDVFHQVVLAEYPRRGAYVIGMVTGRVAVPSINADGEPLLTLFVPNTPNPTSGYLVIIPERDCITLEMSVQEAFKSVISMGVALPDHLREQLQAQQKPATDPAAR